MKRTCSYCTRRNDQHNPDCPLLRSGSRLVRLTPAGNRKAFEQSLERIQQHMEGVLT
jgi:hypothetical protein